MAAFSPRQDMSLALLLAEAFQGITTGTPIIIVPDGILGMPFETLVLTPGTDVKDMPLWERCGNSATHNRRQC